MSGLISSGRGLRLSEDDRVCAVNLRPEVRVCHQQIAGEFVIVAMAAATGAKLAGEVTTDEGQIADAVEQFVPCTFVGDVLFVVDGSIGSEDEHVLRSHSESESL